MTWAVPVGDGLAMVPFGQGSASMSAPAKEFERLIDLWECNRGCKCALKADTAAAKAADELLKAGRAFFGPMRATVDGVFAAALGDGRAPSMVAHKRLLDLMLRFDAANTDGASVSCLLAS